MKHSNSNTNKETGQLNVEIAKTVIRQLAQHCVATDRKKKEVVETALIEYFNNHPIK